MATLVCGKCGHIEFNEVTAKCAVCGAEASLFTDRADAINKPADPANPTEAEKKHVPTIVVVKECGLIPDGSCTDVHARVGEIEHVMDEDHYIRYLDFYIDLKFISRVWLSPVACHPAAALHLRAESGTVTVIENCNKHGNWSAEADLS